MKFLHEKRYKIKDSMDEISFKYILHNIDSWYRQISTHKVAKIQLLGTKIHYNKF